MDVVPGSASTLLAATHIVRVRVEAAQPSAWSPADALVKRSLELQLQLLEVFKGEVREAAGETVKVTVEQFGHPTGRIFAFPGLWSRITPTPGSEWIVCSVAAPEEPLSLVRLVPDPAVQRVLPASESLIDVQLAIELEAARKPLDAVIARASEPATAARLGELFIEWFWARFGSRLAEESGRRLILGLWVLPELSGRARASLLSPIEGQVTRSLGVPPELTADVVRAGFVLLANPGAAQLHDELIDPVLPILVGIGSGLPRRPAGDVFRDRPRERDSARRALDAYSGRSPVEPLKAWLDAPDS